MHRSTLRGSAGALAVLCTALLAVSASAETVALIDPATGADSGWQVSFPDSQMINIVVDAVTPDVVVIQKFVNYEDPPGPGGVFPGVNLDFVQTQPDNATVPTIIIADESLTNLTGAPWGGFNWLVVDGGNAWFNVPASEDFSTSPFNNQTYGGFVGGDPDRATTLRTSGGVVPHLGSFFPGAGAGELVIDVDLAASAIASFDLKQIPTPEPATLALLGLGAAVMMRRRRNA